MKPARQEIIHEPAAAQHHTLLMGMACTVLSASHVHQERPLAYLRQLLTPALNHQQVKFYFNKEGRPIGYIVWASLAEDVEARFVAQRAWLLHECEWNEGNSVWIIDLVVRPGYARVIMRDLRNNFFIGLSRLRYARVRGGHLRLHELERQDGRSYLRYARA